MQILISYWSFIFFIYSISQKYYLFLVSAISLLGFVIIHNLQLRELKNIEGLGDLCKFT